MAPDSWDQLPTALTHLETAHLTLIRTALDDGIFQELLENKNRTKYAGGGASGEKTLFHQVRACAGRRSVARGVWESVLADVAHGAA